MSCTTQPALTAGGCAGAAGVAAGGGVAGAGTVGSGAPPHEVNTTAKVTDRKTVRMDALLEVAQDIRPAVKITPMIIPPQRDRAAREMTVHGAKARQPASSRRSRATPPASHRLLIRRARRR